MEPGRSANRWVTLASTSLAHGINDGTGIIVPLLVAALNVTGRLSFVELAAVSVAYYGSSVLLSVFAGNWADRSGRPGALLGLGLGLLATGFVVFYVALTYAEGGELLVAMLVAASITGLGSSFYHPLGGSLLQAQFPGRRRGLALGVNGMLGSAGRAVYPSLYFLLALGFTGFGPVALIAAIAYVSAGIVWGTLREPAAGPRREAPKPGMARRVATSAVLTITAIALVRSVATQGIAYWIPTYIAKEQVGGFTSSVGVLQTVMYLPAIFGQPVFGWLIGRYDARWVLGLATVGAGASILGFLDVAGWANILLLALFGLFTFSGFPLFLGLVADYVPEEESSTGNALVWGLGMSGGAVVGPSVVAGLAVGGSLGFGFGIMGGLILVVALGTALIPKPLDPRSPASAPPEERGP